MNSFFLVFGYGVPKDIIKDENYNFYLKMVFNKIYSISSKDKTRPMIIFCGGLTDCLKPYKRNEADEMIKLFTFIVRQRSFLKPITQKWLLVPEKNSLSTLENIINGEKIISKYKMTKTNIIIFCEQTREKRIKILANKIFNKNFNLQIVPIDFDASVNRYLSPDFLDEKERVELKQSLWALQSQGNLKKYHEVFEEKLKYFRKSRHKTHTNVVKEWWERKLKEIK